MAWPYFYPTQLRPEFFSEESLPLLPQQQQKGAQQQQNPFASYLFQPDEEMTKGYPPRF